MIAIGNGFGKDGVTFTLGLRYCPSARALWRLGQWHLSELQASVSIIGKLL